MLADTRWGVGVCACVCVCECVQAAALAMRDTSAYNTRIREYVSRYCKDVEREFTKASGGRVGSGGDRPYVEVKTYSESDTTVSLSDSDG